MKNLALFFALSLVPILASPALSDDQQKAQKEINRITAMATDFDGRRVVNLTLSETFNVPRPSLVDERTQTGLNYGGLFIARELIQSGASADDIAAKLKSGITINAVADQQHADWKKITLDAKKLNSDIDQNLYNFFLGKKETADRDTADKYDVHYDGVKADAEIAQQEIASAQERYQKAKDRASAQGKKQGLSAGDERVAYSDHVENGGPQGGGRGVSGTAGTSAPVGMSGSPR